MKNFWVLFLGLVVFQFCCFGCGADKGKCIVTGKVTYKDSPVAGATVSFAPGDPEGLVAYGTTDAEGMYRLTSLGAKKQGSGAQPGTYKVSIVKRKQAELTPDQEALQKKEISFEEYQKRAAVNQTQNQGNRPLPLPVSLIPTKYASPATSGLDAVVQEKEKNTFDFLLID